MNIESIRKIIVLGPESTGKSTLCEQLAQHYNTPWCPEFAREYLLQHGSKYTYDDLLKIAKGQLALEEKYVSLLSNKQQKQDNLIPTVRFPLSTVHCPLLFIDTDMYVMKVWSEYVFGKCHTFILEKAAAQQAALYLLCDIDLPWAYDELREYPDLKNRQELFQLYKDILINQSVPWAVINGNIEQRLHAAIEAVEKVR